MAKRTYRRRYRKKVRKIMNNYFNAKLDYVFRVSYDSSGSKLVEWNTDRKDLNGMLESCSDWPNFAKVFHTFKLRGIAISTSPNVPIPQDGLFSMNGTVLLAIMTGADSPDSFQNVVESQCCLMLTNQQCQRKYISFNGGQTSWIATSDLTDLDGKLCVKTNSNAQSGGCIWSVHIRFYVSYKNPN